jgi:hypothetical protein
MREGEKERRGEGEKVCVCCGIFSIKVEKM